MPSPVALNDFDAVLFDLDGVLTTTRTVHAAAWKRTFDAFLADWDATHGTTTPLFDDRVDYAAHVDGRTREEGVHAFLASRGITLPPGSPGSPPQEDSDWGLGNRKQLLVEEELERSGVEAFPGSVAWLREVREAGLRTAVVSSSRNCAAVLERAGIANLFDARVDGETILELGLPGKPAPDAFLEGARRVGVDPRRAVVVEDALAGVEAGRAGGFGLVVGVDRDRHAQALAEHGADVVVADLADLLADPDEVVHRAGPRGHRLRDAARRIMAASTDVPPDPWRMVEHGVHPATVEQTETLFALANGYLGIRGAFDEGAPAGRPATLLNGFHETWPISYPEHAHGFATTGQTILPVPDGTAIRLHVGEEPVTCENTEVLEFERVLDMRRGVLGRTVVLQLVDGRRFRLRSERMVSLAQRHLAVIRYEITALDAPARVVLSSELVAPVDDDTSDTPGIDPRQSRRLVGAMRAGPDRTDGSRVVRAYSTTRSGLTVGVAMDHDVDPGMTHVGTRVDAQRARVVYDVETRVGEPVGLTKWLAYHHGRDETADLMNRAGMTIHRARDAGLAAVRAAHEREVERFWERSEVALEGASAAQQAVHFNQFALLQATLRSEGHGVPSKGLTGTGYEGHYFWDTEAYLLPFLVHTSPRVARSLLMHRVRMLPAARRRAAEVGCKGALFPWRTINGEEASAYYAAGTAQFHIDADVAYALVQYVTVTGDEDLMVRHGAELLVETARMWAALGFFSDRHEGKFIILKVTGPDEYSTVVDNNLYTNLMAAENLRAAADTLAWMAEQHPREHGELVARLGVSDDEPATWRRAAELMYVPFDEKAGVHLQDDGFMDLAPWDFAGTPAESYPLLLHFHPLVIYRHQVIKQADVVLATVMLPDRFTPAERRRIFSHYDPLTTGDSSLSECVQAIAAADVGKFRTAEEYLVDAAAIDLADRAGNLRDGVHAASAAGLWMALVQGFAGYRWRGTEFSPMLPTRVRRLCFPLTLRGSVLEVDVREHEVTYRLRSGEPVTARHRGERFTVSVDAPVSFPGEYRTRD